MNTRRFLPLVLCMFLPACSSASRERPHAPPATSGTYEIYGDVSGDGGGRQTFSRPTTLADALRAAGHTADNWPEHVALRRYDHDGRHTTLVIAFKEMMRSAEPQQNY